jgi:succinoglycan biosynthesis protein ExoM
MSKENNHISVCICTYKRPEHLERLLHEIQKQITNDKFTYSVVIVDNDQERTAEKTVDLIRQKTDLSIEYYNEPTQNISLARNRAVEMSTGDFVAFIDDDEVPVSDWLLKLYNLCQSHNADGVLGPVKPHFEVPPPSWIVKGKLFDRKSFETGTVLTKTRDTRTGNVLINKRLFQECASPFDARFGKTGGEDTDFFRRMLLRGKVFIWCDEACAYETVPPERCTRKYLLKRALLRGVVIAHKYPFDMYATLQSCVAFMIYSSALPFLLVTGQHLFMKILIKNCDHIGRLLGTLNIALVKERDF